MKLLYYYFHNFTATDLEIEEWQNAYELQTMRVKQLELQLHEKKSLLETQDAKVLQLKSLSNQLKLRLAAETDKTVNAKTLCVKICHFSLSIEIADMSCRYLKTK